MTTKLFDYKFFNGFYAMFEYLLSCFGLFKSEISSFKKLFLLK